MRVSNTLLAGLLGSAASVAAYSSREELHNRAPKRQFTAPVQPAKRATNSSGSGGPYMNAKSAQYHVNGNKIPFVDFDVGDSFAGQMSISNKTDDENKLFFWFFPSENQDASDEIAIWLNGGPGCSSLDGFLQENGPFMWQSGIYRPLENPYAWNKLTNMVWVDQPIGTGLSPAAKGAPKKIVNEEITAKEFMGFWKNFMETFDLKGRKVYILGESYAGMYVPYISYYMLMANDTDYYNVKGIQINDPSIGNGDVLTQGPAFNHMATYKDIFNLNQTTFDDLAQRNSECGWDTFMDEALTYPPTKAYPKLPAQRNSRKCDIWGDIVEAAVFANPCFNIYHLIDFCPYLWDVMGFPSLGQQPFLYFNRTDVQQVLNVKNPINYLACGNPTLGLEHDQSVPSAFGPLPHVIEMTNNVNLGSGSLDYLLLTNGTLATVQNMTWNGMRGFQSKPATDFFVPYPGGLDAVEFDENTQPLKPPPVGLIGGGGYLGITHKERGLTWFEVFHSGHEIPQYQPGASFRQLEYLLGRVKDVTSTGEFTVPVLG